MVLVPSGDGRMCRFGTVPWRLYDFPTLLSKKSVENFDSGVKPTSPGRGRFLDARIHAAFLDADTGEGMKILASYMLHVGQLMACTNRGAT